MLLSRAVCRQYSCCLLMSSENSSSNSRRRLLQLRRILHQSQTLSCKLCSSTRDGDWLEVGDSRVSVSYPHRPELVPRLYAVSNERLHQNKLKHLKWMIQKSNLGQDMFLIGPPGTLQRHLALQYCELTGREVEYVSLSRDTTETDLKQRREIFRNTVHYIDQAAVRAAVEGRVLVLEGIEKAERNVLPILNNLLENREMQLEDGRFIVAAERYDKLAKEYSRDKLDSWKLVRASEHFRVIALGQPVPPYKGNSLDPPLRSRFQARHVLSPPYPELLSELKTQYSNIPESQLTTLLSVCYTLQSLTASSAEGAVNLSSAVERLAAVMNAVPNIDMGGLIHSTFPAELMGCEQLLQDTLQRFGISSKSSTEVAMLFPACSPTADGVSVSLIDGSRLSAPSNSGNVIGQFVVPGYPDRAMSDTQTTRGGGGGGGGYVSVSHHEGSIATMLQSHIAGDLCLVGPRGCGKTTLVNRFAHMLGYVPENIVLYSDMTSRELLQQRSTLPNGDTSWTLLPLVTAARKGHLAILDGIHQLDIGTLAVIKRLVQDRELQLTDGTRLMGEGRYQAAMQAAKLTPDQMEERSIFSVHPKFRIVATAEPEKGRGVGGATWLTPEVLSMFAFHHLTPLPPDQEKMVIREKVPGVSDSIVDPLVNFARSLRVSSDPTVQSLAASLSTRQLIRIARKMSAHPDQCLHTAILRACLARFLPSLARTTLLKVLSDGGIVSPGPEHVFGTTLPSIECERRGGSVRIGKTEVPVRHHSDTEVLVPDVVFHDNSLHLHIMEEMLKDYMLGEHLLLVGNQGVGKNKITDRFLHLLNLPREYLQLHRDSTVQTLTSQLSVVDGRITHQDSPLVRAVQNGRVLVVDEADKAPIHVTAILRNIVGGESITLADGRRIVSSDVVQTGKHPHPQTDRLIPIHPDFRMIVLANRPGFPFLGNDFFAALGDSFSCHAVDNPDLESEMVMLRQYGPAVPQDVLRRLVEAFSELREMADSGLLAYPYSTREVVNIVKHLQEYPGEGVASVVRNVFDFDSYSPELLEIVLKTLHKHGIPAGASASDVVMSPEYPLSPLVLSAELRPNRSQTAKLVCKNSSVSLKVPSRVPIQWVPCERDTVRSRRFSELKYTWTVPLHESIFVTAACLSRGPTAADLGTLHMLTGKLPALYSLHLSTNTLRYLDLFPYLPSSWGSWKPRFSLTSFPTGPHAGSVLLHEAESRSLFLLSGTTPTGVDLFRLSIDSKMDSLLPWKHKRKQGVQHLLSGLSQDNVIVLHEPGSDELVVVDFSRQQPHGHTIFLPTSAKRVHLLSLGQWIVEDNAGNCHLLSKQGSHDTVSVLATPLTTVTGDGAALMSVSAMDVPSDVAAATTVASGGSHSSVVSSNNGGVGSLCRLVVPEQALAGVVSGVPVQDHDDGGSVSVHVVGDISSESAAAAVNGVDKSSPVYLPGEGSIVYPFIVTGNECRSQDDSGVCVINLARRTAQRIKFPQKSSQSNVPVVTSPRVHLCGSGSNVVAVDHRGVVRLLEVSRYSLHKSLQEWKRMVGEEDSSDPLQLTFSRKSGLDTTKPKHGKVDPKNAPHVGGNTWAGGTGGRDTAGLGGKGGPYRLDVGHNVYQLSDEEKMAVPEEVKRAARELGQKALRERLKEIEMSEHDAKMYRDLLSRVQQQVQTLKVMLNNIQSKSTEREWLRHQTTGDLDERKLIDGLTGEKAIYKRRGERAPEFGAEQVYPKRIKMVVDVSGSMYRFNGHDGRLDRMLESVLMVMEAFTERHSKKFKLDIDGHSGDAPVIKFYNGNTPPSNDKERLDVLKAMHAHSQFCWTGDNTVEATKAAITAVAKGPAEQRFVIILSDANFSQYRIDPKTFGALMTSDPSISVFAVFVGSLGDQAERLKEVLPAGRSFICMDTRDLPIILQQILSSSLQ